MLEDKLLVEQFKAGDADAFRKIYEKYLDGLLSLAINLLGDCYAAEDVVQDVFIKFGQTIENFELKRTLKGFLSTCVANRARDVYRAQKRHRNTALDQAFGLADGIEGPDQKIIDSERAQALHLALDQLPWQQREVIILHINGGLKFREIAEIKQISIKTVQSRYRYGLNKMRVIYDKKKD